MEKFQQHMEQVSSLLQYPNKFCHIKGWKLDGTEVTDTTEGISISADGSELTLSEVKKEHSVEAIFDAATMYEVS